MVPKYPNSNHQKFDYWCLVVCDFWLLARYCLIIGAWLLVIPVTPARAETMESSNYKIRLGNFNMTSGLKSSTSYTLTDTVGQTAAEFFSSTGYHVKAGFQYIYTLYDFSFTLSSLLISFGSLTPDSFPTETQDLVVSAPGQGYSISAIASDRLKNLAGDEIDDTPCDTSCDADDAAAWTNPTQHGFGYNVSGVDADPDFADNTYFRPFPNASFDDSAALIAISSTAGQDRTSTVTYQINIPTTQAAGDYSTQITYIATPVY